MPYRPLKACRKFGCAEVTDSKSGYCPEHREEADKYRGSAYKRGYDGQWVKESKRYLRHNPLCVECLKDNKCKPATVVDHIIPHRGNKLLFWDKSNWQSLCKHHHDQKTARGE